MYDTNLITEITCQNFIDFPTMWFFTKQLHFKQTTKHKAFYNEVNYTQIIFCQQNYSPIGKPIVINLYFFPYLFSP